MSQQEDGRVWPSQPPAEPAYESEKVLTGERASFGTEGLTVHKCAACDGKHEGIVMSEYTRPPAPFTHWYDCPTLGDPVPVALAMMTNGGGMELNGPVCHALAAAQVAGRFMVMVCYHEDGKLRMRVTTNKFPTGDYFETADAKGVLGTLKEMLEREVGTLQQQQMRQAVLPQPIRELFGNSQPSNKQEFKLPPQVAAVMAQAQHAAGANGSEPQQQ